MIGNIIAYTIVTIFAVFGVFGIVGALFDKAPDRTDGFWGGIVFLGVSLIFAWMWGI